LTYIAAPVGLSVVAIVIAAFAMLRKKP
jgi:hypothetical protein